MIDALLIVAALVFFLLAGLNIRGPRFSPEWYGVGLVVAVWFAPILTLHR